jgi:hypothetical protein
MRAEVDNLSPGGDCEGYGIGAAEADTIPSTFVGVLLGRNEVAELEKIVLADTPKRPPAPSMANDNSGERQRVYD